MSELKQMGWMVLGVLVGFALGVVVYFGITQVWGQVSRSPSLSIVLAVPILGGGLVGGGALAQWLVKRYVRTQKRRRQREKDEAKGRKGKRK